jgi:hypothetical protein
MILAIMEHSRAYGPSLFYVFPYLLSFKAATGPPTVPERYVMVTSIQEALEAYDREHAFARSVLLPEEDRAKLTAARWEGGYRWFRTRNVVCLEKAQRLRAEGRI